MDTEQFDQSVGRRRQRETSIFPAWHGAKRYPLGGHAAKLPSVGACPSAPALTSRRSLLLLLGRCGASGSPAADLTF